ALGRGCTCLASARLRRAARITLAEFVAATTMKILAAITAVLLAPPAPPLGARFAALPRIVPALARAVVARRAVLRAPAPPPTTRPPHLDQFGRGRSLRSRRSRRLRRSGLGRRRSFGRNGGLCFRLGRRCIRRGSSFRLHSGLFLHWRRALGGRRRFFHRGA